MEGRSVSADDIKTAPVGSRVYFEGERMPYTVQARDERFIICTKPFAARRTVIYSIIDLERDVRGPDNMVFGGGYETRDDCEHRLAELMNPNGDMEVSRRNCVTLAVAKVKVPA